MLIEARPYNADLGDFDTRLDPLLKRIYLARGITDSASLERKLSCLPAPTAMQGIPAAVELLVEALRQQKKVLIVGDFDADGATSAALMVLALTAMGYREVDFLVPNRFDYGYGLTPEIVDLAQQKSPDLIITVDNGISSIEGVAHANKLGIQVIVTDHHLPGATFPMLQPL